MKNTILILLVALVFLGSSCKDFLSVNEKNPNTASKVEVSLLLPAALNGVSNTMNNPRRFEFVYLWHGMWSISAGYSQPQNLVQYKLLNSNYQGAFLEFYTVGNNLDIIEKSGKLDANNVYYVAIAKIFKAYIFQNLVDCWGNVPYSEAFKTPSVLKPKYDDQKNIYKDLVIQLDSAINLIGNAPSSVIPISGSSDIIYAGDMSLWQKFANTLKLRILVHQADVSGATSYISGAIASTSSVGYIGSGEGALANPGFSVSEGKMNPFYETFYSAAGTSQSDGISYYFAGKDAVDFYKNVNDPRLSRFYNSYTSPPSAPAFDGNVFGKLPDDLVKSASTSKLGYIKNSDGSEEEGTMIGNAKKSAPILTDFESLFIQAEAAQRNLISGDAKALYEKAVTRSFVHMGLASGLATNFLASAYATVNFDVASNKLQLILTQKWAALNGVAPVEVWTDYRRTGYPNFLHFSVDPAKSGPGTPPVRLLYPQTEITVNNANVVAVGTIDAFTSKIFWQTR